MCSANGADPLFSLDLSTATWRTPESRLYHVKYNYIYPYLQMFTGSVLPLDTPRYMHINLRRYLYLRQTNGTLSTCNVGS
jgi:hypothetical protein